MNTFLTDKFLRVTGIYLESDPATFKANAAFVVESQTLAEPGQAAPGDAVILEDHSGHTVVSLVNKTVNEARTTLKLRYDNQPATK